MNVLEIMFWTALLGAAYVYLGYPLLLAFLTRGRGQADEHADGFDPTVELVISAYNEQDVIAEKLDNALALDYSRGKLIITVVSDGSTDRTNEIVNSYAENHGTQRVRLLALTGRDGKTAGLNIAASRSVADVLIFSDANALYAPDAVRRLVAPMTDERVGAVVGRSSYTASDSAAGSSEISYWDYEVWLKTRESLLGSVVGGDGAILATRRSLYDGLPTDAISDFLYPLQLVQRGYRVVYEPRAVCSEEAANSFGKEYRRKVRIINRSFRALGKVTELLDPFRHGWFAVALWSHKFLRWLLGLNLIVALGTNIFLLGVHPIYALTFVAQAAFWLAAAAGWLLRDNARLPEIAFLPFYFMLANWAGLVGIFRALRGEKIVTWETPRSEAVGEDRT